MNKACVAGWLLLLGPAVAAAQVNDAGLWTAVTLKKKITRSWAVCLSQEIRLYENLSEVGTFFTDAAVEYKVVKSLDVEVHYRFIRKKQVDDFYEGRHRWYADVAYNYRIRKVTLELRERFQMQYAQVQNDNKSQSPENHLRSRLKAEADLGKKYTPFLSFEWKYQLNNPAGNETDRLRYAAGVTYDFDKYRSLVLSYLINKDVNGGDPVTDYVSGIEFRQVF